MEPVRSLPTDPTVVATLRAFDAWLHAVKESSPDEHPDDFARRVALLTEAKNLLAESLTIIDGDV